MDARYGRTGEQAPDSQIRHPASGTRPQLKALVREASQALAHLDAVRLEELAASCQALNGSLPSMEDSRRMGFVHEVHEAVREMGVLGRVLEATRSNLRVIHRLRALRAARIEYSERQARGWPAESAHGND